jgi:hypothetical protein
MLQRHPSLSLSANSGLCGEYIPSSNIIVLIVVDLSAEIFVWATNYPTVGGNLFRWRVIILDSPTLNATNYAIKLKSLMAIYPVINFAEVASVQVLLLPFRCN